VTRPRRDRVAAIEILDDAVRLLRAAPWSAHLCFQAGSLPFVLGLLLFVLDMRLSALAPRHAGGAALLMALLYLWMKGWQVAAADRLRAAWTGSKPGAARADRVRRVVMQGAIQPWSLFVLPVALVLAFPFGWVYAYYHAVTLAEDAPAARAQAMERPLENHVLVLLLSLASGIVFLNLLVVVLGLPFVLSSLLGVETPFSRSPMLLFDPTFLLALGGLTYLVMGPVAHAAYLVRAERAASLRTGSDLLREIESLPPAARGRAVACGLALLLTAAFMPSSTRAAEAAPVSPAPARDGLAPRDLDRAMRAVTARPEFLWRMPRPVPPPDAGAEPGLFGSFLRSAANTLKGWGDGIARAFGRLVRWIDRHLGEGPAADPAPGARPAWPARASWLLLALFGVGAGAALLTWWRRRVPVPVVQAIVTTPATRADVGTAAASDAPSDEWLARASELLDHGDLRLAARAIYLATLALLGEARLLTLGRARSDRDYLLELRRRRPDRPEMAELFQSGVREFERVWYGTHPASADLVRGLGERCESLRRHARG
jgi:hypothetical protein